MAACGGGHTVGSKLRAADCCSAAAARALRCRAASEARPSASRRLRARRPSHRRTSLVAGLLQARLGAPQREIR